MELRAHDLVAFTQIDDLLFDGPAPEWLPDALEGACYAVVRRAKFSDKGIPIGIRGKARGQRLAGWIQPDRILSVITPFELTNLLMWKPNYSASMPYTVASLIKINSILNATGLQWGPTGSTGFELATGKTTIKGTSDLDLVFYAPKPIDVAYARALLEKIQGIASCRLDVQLDTPSGGISLIEYSQSEQVLVKTAQGPLLLGRKSLWDKHQQFQVL